MRRLAGRYGRHLAEHPEQSLVDVCYTAAIGRAHFQYRLALAVEERETAVAQLQAFADGGAGIRYAFVEPQEELAVERSSNTEVDVVMERYLAGGRID